MIDILQQDTVYALAKSADAVYAARMSGLYRSTDAGTTWQNVFTSLEKPEALTATAVIAAGSTIFAGVKGAVLRSDDAGAGWHIAGLASPPPLVVALAVSPNFRKDGMMFAATAEDGVFVSADRGTTWTGWNYGLLDLNIFALAVSPDFAHDSTLYAGTESGIFVSHNHGRTWRDLPFPMDAAPVLSLAVAAAGRLYAGTEKNGLFISADAGMTWQQVSRAASAAVNALQMNTKKVYALLEDSLLVSGDGGTSWEAHPVQFPPDALAMTLLLHPTPGAKVMVGFADGEIVQL